jgi:hypothetical protein
MKHNSNGKEISCKCSTEDEVEFVATVAIQKVLPNRYFTARSETFSG